MATSVPALPGVRGLHHVAIAVACLDEALEGWLSMTGGTLELRAVVQQQGVEAACIEWADAAGNSALVHGTMLELIAPLVPGEGGVARFLDRRGPGLHHIAYAVDDVAAALAACREHDLRTIDDEPRIGLHGTPVAFLHPSACAGTLVELVEGKVRLAHEPGSRD